MKGLRSLIRASARDRALGDVAGARDRAVRFTVHIAALQRLALLVRGQLRLAPELHALRPAPSAAQPAAVRSRMRRSSNLAAIPKRAAASSLSDSGLRPSAASDHAGQP